MNNLNNLITGKLIRKLRKEKNLNTVDFAERLEVSQASISRIEGGVQEVTYSMLIKICNELEITLSAFFIKLEQQINPTIEVSIENSASDITLDDELFNIIKSLSEEQKKGLYVLLFPYTKD